MKILPFLLSIASAASLISCSSAVVKNPPADTTPENLRKNLEGTWLFGEEVFFVRFDQKGAGYGAAVNEEDGKLGLEKFSFNALKLAEDGDQFVLWIHSEEEDEPEEFLLTVGKNFEDDTLVFWPVNVEALVDYVEKHQLKHTVEKGKHSVTLEIEDGPALIESLRKSGLEGLLYLEEPIVGRRIVRPDDEAD